MNTENLPIGLLKPLPMSETKSNSGIIPFKNKKRNNIKMAALYDNMISTTYTLHNGELDKEKIANQKVSFVAHKC